MMDTSLDLMRLKNHLKKTPLFMTPYRGVNRLLNSHYRKKKLVMLHHGRCGSSVLGNLLNQHPKIYWAGEIFEAYMKGSKRSQPNFVEQTLKNSSNMRTSELYGFETKYLAEQHLSEGCINMTLKAYIAQLRDLGYEHFILLHRSNYLRRAISAEIARQQQSWHTQTTIKTAQKITLDINKVTIGIANRSLLESFESLDASYEKLQTLLQPTKVLVLSYEKDILENPICAYQKSCAFLNIKPASPQIKLKRTNPFPLEELLVNYEEVKALLTNTKYSWMLEG